MSRNKLIRPPAVRHAVIGKARGSVRSIASFRKIADTTKVEGEKEEAEAQVAKHASIVISSLAQFLGFLESNGERWPMFSECDEYFITLCRDMRKETSSKNMDLLFSDYSRAYQLLLDKVNLTKDPINMRFDEEFADSFVGHVYSKILFKS
jgi:hypothetical protein